VSISFSLAQHQCFNACWFGAPRKKNSLSGNTKKKEIEKKKTLTVYMCNVSEKENNKKM
jgi:hypothetical protein